MKQHETTTELTALMLCENLFFILCRLYFWMYYYNIIEVKDAACQHCVSQLNYCKLLRVTDCSFNTESLTHYRSTEVYDNNVCPSLILLSVQ